MRTPFHLHGQTILVTGATSGIGRQCALRIASMGGTIAATGRSGDRLADLQAQLPAGNHTGFPADLTSDADRDALVASLPPLDGVVHAAGIVSNVSLRFVSRQQLDDHFAINFDAPLLLTQRLLARRLLKPGASIVAVASTAALVGMKTIGAYSASKAALIAGARVLALELAPSRIRVNCIPPGMVRTPLLDGVAEAVSTEALDEHEKQYPLGYGDPDDIACAAVYLLSDASRWVTGSTLVVDGGATCR